MVCFNPHRPRRAGAAGLELLNFGLSADVSILTGPEGPVLPEKVGDPHVDGLVSILTGPEGPVLPPWRSAMARA